MGEWEVLGGIKIMTSSVAWISKDAIYWAIKEETGGEGVEMSNRQSYFIN